MGFGGIIQQGVPRGSLSSRCNLWWVIWSLYRAIAVSGTNETGCYGMTWLLVFLGGGLGSITRYAVSVFITSYYNNQLPLATTLSNVLSCFVLAIVVSNIQVFQFDDKLVRAALVIGFCGGFSTFSTFSFETIQLIKNGNLLVAVGNVIISVVVCLILLYKLTK